MTSIHNSMHYTAPLNQQKPKGASYCVLVGQGQQEYWGNSCNGHLSGYSVLNSVPGGDINKIEFFISRNSRKDSIWEWGWGGLRIG